MAHNPISRNAERKSQCSLRSVDSSNARLKPRPTNQPTSTEAPIWKMYGRRNSTTFIEFNVAPTIIVASSGPAGMRRRIARRLAAAVITSVRAICAGLPCKSNPATACAECWGVVCGTDNQCATSDADSTTTSTRRYCIIATMRASAP